VSNELTIIESGAWGFNIDESGEWNFVLTDQGSNPVVTSVTVGSEAADNIIMVYFGKNLDVDGLPTETDFVITFSGGAVTITGIQIYESEETHNPMGITLNRVIVAGETGTVAYSGTALIGENGYTVAAFTKSVTNNT